MAHMMSPQSLKTPRAGFQKVTLVWYRRKLKKIMALKNNTFYWFMDYIGI
jgi:hypothetical protein